MKNNVQIRISGRYKIDSIINQTKSSQVFEGMNIHTAEQVAIKLEPKNANNQLLNSESEKLKKLQGGICIPTFYTSGTEGDYNFLVMELLGRDLASYLNICKGSFSLKTTLMIADQLFQGLEFIHERDIIHRHIKPANICLGGESNFFHINLVDFGFSKFYVLQDTKKHIPMQDGKVFIGEEVYASVNNHEGKEQSRKDDLESSMYMLMHILTGSLPWIPVIEDDKLRLEEKRKEVLKLKREFLHSEYWDKALLKVSGVNQENEVVALPIELKDLYGDITSIGFNDTPDYGGYRRVFKELMVKNFLEYDYIYDWFLIPVAEIGDQNLDFLEGFDKNDYEVKFKEERELKELISEYEDDPRLIDFRMDEIRKKNDKFDSQGRNKKWKKKKEVQLTEVQMTKMEKFAKVSKRDKKKKKKKKKKDKDCNLI